SEGRISSKSGVGRRGVWVGGTRVAVGVGVGCVVQAFRIRMVVKMMRVFFSWGFSLSEYYGKNIILKTF
ncbi:MAG: hypothetical protein KAH06_01420, partial [Desulfobacterales bacterium]|nr:hypothetical protein [Desulfobacterales bacterium]